jgi:NADPH-dependent ferric siderophore reductase
MSTASKKQVSFIENVLTKTGTVQAVRAWHPQGVYEVDVHLPQANMQQWEKVQKMKCRVAPYTFRDYTPFCLDAANNLCRLYIDAAHKGPGSRWVQQLQPGTLLHYLGIDSARHAPEGDSHMVFLGDQTAIGHFCALQQLAGNHTPVSGAIVLQPQHHATFSSQLPQLPLAVYALPSMLFENFHQWLAAQSFTSNPVFYLAGNSHMVAALRKALREEGFNNGQIKVQGFWH